MLIKIVQKNIINRDVNDNAAKHDHVSYVRIELTQLGGDIKDRIKCCSKDPAPDAHFKHVNLPPVALLHI
jgi:hypothetical protein